MGSDPSVVKRHMPLFHVGTEHKVRLGLLVSTPVENL